MKLNFKKIFLGVIVGMVLSTTGNAGTHINLSSEPSDYQDVSSFMKMCVEYNAELPNVESVCQMQAALHFAQH